MSAPKMGLSPGAAVVVLTLSLAGCTSSGAAPGGAADPSEAALACALPSNCVNSLPGSDLAPLRFAGSADEAIDALRASLSAFPEARIVSIGSLTMAVVFTTPVGFRDRVDFQIDTPGQRINFRSSSSFGLYDFGKNRSRMKMFAVRFEQDRAR